MSWFDFEVFNLGHTLNKLGKNPERALVGAGDPFSTRMWNGILGTKWEPLVNQQGGPSKDAYEAAEAKGIDTGSARQGHRLIGNVASIMALPSAMNGLSNAASAPTAAGGAAAGGSAAAPSSGGLWSGLSSGVDKYGKTASTAMTLAQQSGLLGGQQQQAPQAPFGGGQSVGSVYGGLLDAQQQVELQRRQRRGLLG